MSSIRDHYAKTYAAELPDGTRVEFARMTIADWRDLAGKIRDERLKAEMVAIGAVKDPILQQTLRLRANAFEPSYYDLIDSAQTPSGIERVLVYAAKKTGVDEELAKQLPDLLEPVQVRQVMDAIVHAPLGPKIGGNLTEDQSPNPTEGGSSSPPEEKGVAQPGSESPSTSTGKTCDGEQGESTASTSTT